MISTLISSEARYPVSRPKIKSKVEEILKKFGVDEAQVSVSIVGNRKMKQLNSQFRELEETTNVLSFPLEEPRGEDGVLRLGDVVISYPEAQRQAIGENKLVDAVVSELLEHGLMHLLGYNHDNGTEFKVSAPKNFSTGS